MTSPAANQGWKRLLRRVRRAATVLLVLALGTIALVPLADQYVNELIRTEVQERLSRHYKSLEVRLRGAERVPGVGIELRGLTIRDPRSDPQLGHLVAIDEILVRCETALQSLAAGDLRARQVVLRRPKLRSARAAGGTSSLEQLLPLPQLSRNAEPPLIVIEDGELHWSNTPGGGEPVELHSIQMMVQRRGAARGAMEPPWHIAGTCSGADFRQAKVTGNWHAQTGQWSIQGEVQDIKITPSLVNKAPADAAAQLRPLATLRGKAELTFQALRDAGRFEYSVDGRFADGWIKDELLPYSLTDLSADFHLGHDGLRIENARARLGAAEFQLELVRSGLDPSSPLLLKAETRNFPLDHRLPGMLPAKLKTLWDKFLPAGRANIALVVSFDGRQYRPDVTIDLPDVSFTYHKFPYRVHNAVGRLRVHDGILQGNLQMPISGKTVHLRCEATNLADRATGWAEIETDGAIPLDEALIRALGEKPERLVRSLQPSGMIELFGRFERRHPDQEKFEKRLEIHLRNCAMRYEKFPYPIDRIQGTVTVENGRWSFTRLTGRNDSAFLVARGSWDSERTDRPHLELHFECTDVPLEESLRGALREDLRRLWSKLEPRGSLDHLLVTIGFDRHTRQLDVEVQGQKWPPQQNVEGRSLSLRPAWFPYRWDNVTGQFHFARGVVTIENVQAEHGTTRLKRFEGVCEYDSNGKWSMNIPVLDVEDLTVDDQLLAALPPRLAQPLGRVTVQGPVSLAGEMRFADYDGQPGNIEADWALHLDMEDGHLQCGVALEHVRGGIDLRGQARRGMLENRAELHVDSLVARGVHFSQIRGPLRLDADRLFVGAAADAAPSPSGAPRSVSARVFDGQLALDGHIDTSAERRFEVFAALAEADLARIASEAEGLVADVSGRTFASLRLSGQAGARHTWRGESNIRLFDADIYQLPLMVALLKLPNVKAPDPTAFTNSDMRLRIEGERAYFDRIALQGDAISLIGNGEMNAQRQLDLEFYAVFGREELQLPWFRPLAKEAARNVLGIEVTGTLQQPVVLARPFPELNETLQQLLRTEL